MTKYLSIVIFHALLVLASLAFADTPQIIPASERAKIHALFPEIVDSNYGDIQGDGRDLNDLLHAEDGFDYDKRIGLLYQIGSEGRQRNRGFIGFADASLNIARVFAPQDQPDSRKPHGTAGNPNVMFPWNPLPGMLHRAHHAQTGKNPSGVDDIKRMFLPRKKDGSFWPIVWWRQRLYDTFNPRDQDTFYNWCYPVGTVFFEVMTLKGPDGKTYTFETRTRIREIDGWAVDRHVPCPTAKDLAQAIREWPYDWKGRDQYLDFLSDNDSPREFTLQSGDRGSQRFRTSGLSFNVVCRQDILPPLPHDLVRAILLYKPFKSVLGKEWKPGCTGVTTNEGFHIIPSEYAGGFIGIDRKSCTRCHIDGLDSSRRKDAEVAWYGRVRGNFTRNMKLDPRKQDNGGSILSMHVQEPSVSIGQIEARLFTPNRMFMKGGMLEHYDPKKHPPSRYQRLYVTR